MTKLRVLVTGGGRGIGRAIALRFAREGAQVVVAARTTAEVGRVAREVDAAGGEGCAVHMDVQEGASVVSAIRSATDFTGGVLDVIVNNAGIFDQVPIAEITEASWKQMVDVNLSGPFRVVSAALPALRKGERRHLFNISSVAGKQGFPLSVAYCATKYGLRGFGDALREELRDEGIRVSTVYPGTTDTSIFDDVPGDWDRSTMDSPEDVAEVVWQGYCAPAGEDAADLDMPDPQ